MYNPVIKKLKNGLTLLLVPVKGTETVSLIVNVGAGSIRVGVTSTGVGDGITFPGTNGSVPFTQISTLSRSVITALFEQDEHRTAAIRAKQRHAIFWFIFPHILDTFIVLLSTPSLQKYLPLVVCTIAFNCRKSRNPSRRY